MFQPSNNPDLNFLKSPKMPKFTLYTLLLSPPCRAVELTAKQLGLNLELRQLYLHKGEHLTPEFLKLNPQHTIPTLVDGDTVLWESHAIIAYLVLKYGEPNHPLYPEDLVTRTKIQLHLYFESGVLFARFRFLAEPIFFLGATDLQIERIDYFLKGLDLFEAVLKNQGTPFLVGDQITLADISCMTTISTYESIIPLFNERFSKTKEWLKWMEALPGYLEINKSGVDTFHSSFLTSLARNKAIKRYS